MREIRNTHKILFRKLKQKLPWRCRGRWEDNIKIDLTDIRHEDVNWIHLANVRDQRHTLANMAGSIKGRGFS
jgi:hypothetical protein